MRSYRSFQDIRMLATVGEALLNVGTIEYKLNCSIPRLQLYYGLPVDNCYKKRRIPSLGDQKKPCRSLHDKVREWVSQNAEVYAQKVDSIDPSNEDSVLAMFDFVELADNTEIVYLELDLMLKIIDGLRETRNDLMHSLKLGLEDGLMVTTARRPARVISHRDLAIFLRRSKHGLDVSSSLMVAGVCLATKEDKLYSSFSNGSHNSRFLKKLYGDDVIDLGLRWRNHLMGFRRITT